MKEQTVSESELRELFLESLPERLSLFLNARSASNTQELLNLTHQLSGTALTFGFVDLSWKSTCINQKLLVEDSLFPVEKELEELLASIKNLTALA